jgi:O-antigen/teichoic acid export membrane protein
VTPLIIHKLGPSQYGLYTLIGAFVGYLSILDLGLNNAIIRFVSHYRAKDNRSEEENFLAICLIIYSIISLLIIAVGLFLYQNLDFLFDRTLSAEELSQARVMMIILIINFTITIPGGAFTGICTGYEKFVFPRLMTIIKYVVRTVLVISILYMGSNAIGLVLVDSILNFIFIAITAYYVFKILNVKIKLHAFNFSYIREIINYSFFVFFYAFIYQIQWRSGQFILGISSNTAIVGIYSVGVMLGIYYTTIGSIINGLMLPKAVQSVCNGTDLDQMTEQMIRIGRLTMFILLYFLGAFILMGQDFIVLWVGETYAKSWIVALLIMIAYTIPMAQGYAHSILEARKLLKFRTYSFFIFVVLGLLSGWLLSYKYDSTGMIIGLFGGMIVFQLIMNIYYSKIGFDIWSFFKRTILPYILPFILVLGLAYAVFLFFKTNNWFWFFIKSIIYSVIYLLVLSLILTKEERALVFKPSQYLK